jgi:hypothetical protein
MKTGVKTRVFLVHMQCGNLKIGIGMKRGIQVTPGLYHDGMTIVIVWAILVDATESMEASVIVARLLEASAGVRGGALGFVTGGGTIGG